MKRILTLLLGLITLTGFSQNLERERKLANSFQYDAIVLFSGSVIMPNLYLLNKDLNNPKYFDKGKVIIGLSVGMHVSGFAFLGKSIYHRKRYNFIRKI